MIVIGCNLSRNQRERFITSNPLVTKLLFWLMSFRKGRNEENFNFVKKVPASFSMHPISWWSWPDVRANPSSQFFFECGCGHSAPHAHWKLVPKAGTSVKETPSGKG